MFSKLFKYFLVDIHLAERIFSDHFQVDFVTAQGADVVNSAQDHGGSLQAQPPRDAPDVFGQSHGQQHLGAEHPRISNLHPLFQARMEAEDFQRRLSVRVVGRLEAQLVHAQLFEELAQGSHQVAQGEPPVGDEALDLVELRQMGCVQRLVSEHAVDAEVSVKVKCMFNSMR